MDQSQEILLGHAVLASSEYGYCRIAHSISNNSSLLVGCIVDWQEKIEFWLKSVKRAIGEEVTRQSKGKESDVPVDPGECLVEICFLGRLSEAFRVLLLACFVVT